MIKIYSLDLWCIKLDFWTVIPPFYGLFIQWLLPKNIFSHNPSQQCLSPCRCWCVSFHKLLCPADDPCYFFNNNPRKSTEILLSSHVVRKPTVLVNRNLFQGEKCCQEEGKISLIFKHFNETFTKQLLLCSSALDLSQSYYTQMSCWRHVVELCKLTCHWQRSL